MRRKPFTLYGGARGGGKSYILRWLAVFLLISWFKQGFRGVRVGIFCETFPTLKERQLSRARRGRPAERYPAWLGSWNLQDYEFRLHDWFGGGVVCFRNLDDPDKYLSAEYAAILVDEYNRNPPGTITSLRGSLRWPGIEHTPFVGATNPGGIGHASAKDLFVDGTFELDENKSFIEPDEKTGIAPYKKEDFAYVKALATDNPHNSASYMTMLRSLPERLRAAYLDGNWDVFEGQAFTEWDKAVHVVPSVIAHLREWEWIASMDWGWRKGIMLTAAIGDEGDIEIVHEVEFRHINADDAGFLIPKRWERAGLPKPAMILYDEQMDQDASSHQKGTTKLSEQFASGLNRHYGVERTEDGEIVSKAPPFVPAPHGPGSRKIKFDLTHKYLKFKRDAKNAVQPWMRPLLRVQARCRYLIRTLPALQVDPDKPEDDVDVKSVDDHAYDALGFILSSRVFPIKEPEEKEILPDRHPGIDRKTKRRKKPPKLEEPAVEDGSWSPGWQMPRQDQLIEVTED